MPCSTLRTRVLPAGREAIAIPVTHCGADNRLGSANGIEYASQAIALHGGLLAGKDVSPRQGYLASVRSVALHVARLDDLPGDLIVRAERLSGDDNHILYQFSIEHDAHCLLEGRLAVILDAKGPR